MKTEWVVEFRVDGPSYWHLVSENGRVIATVTEPSDGPNIYILELHQMPSTYADHRQFFIDLDSAKRAAEGYYTQPENP